jgi:hypothetical protein
MDAESQFEGAVASFAAARRYIAETLDERESKSFLAAISAAETATQRIAGIVGVSIERAFVHLNAEPWEATVRNLAPSRARDISVQLCKVSEELTHSFRAIGVRQNVDRLKSAARDAIGFLYTDVLRPLWHAFPDLAPSEMGHRPTDDRNGSV